MPLCPCSGCTQAEEQRGAFYPGYPPWLSHNSPLRRVHQARHLLRAGREKNWGRTSYTEGYLLVSAVSYSLSRSSSKMSTSTLAFPARSGARLMRFLARVMESLSPLLHSMGSSRMAAAGAKALAAVSLGGDPSRVSPSPPIPSTPPGSPPPRKRPPRRRYCSGRRYC